MHNSRVLTLTILYLTVMPTWDRKVFFIFFYHVLNIYPSKVRQVNYSLVLSLLFCERMINVLWYFTPDIHIIVILLFITLAMYTHVTFGTCQVSACVHSEENLQSEVQAHNYVFNYIGYPYKIYLFSLALYSLCMCFWIYSP